MKVRERWAGGFPGYGEVQGQLAGFQPEHLERCSVHREGGGIGRAEREFHT